MIKHNDIKEILPLLKNKTIENNDLKIARIRKELLKSVEKNDVDAYTKIIQALSHKITILIGDGTDRNGLNKIFIYLKSILNFSNAGALRTKNLHYFNVVWKTIEYLYLFGSKNNIPLLHYQQLTTFTRDYIKFLSRNNLGDQLRIGVEKLIFIFEVNLKNNCPPQQKIWGLYRFFESTRKVEHFTDSSLQWDSIIEFLSLINKIQDSSITLRDRELFSTINFELEGIRNNILSDEFSHIEEYQEAYIFIKTYLFQIYNSKSAIKKNMYKDTFWAFQIEEFHIYKLIKKEKFYVGRLLEIITNYAIECQQDNKLDDILFLNKIATIARASVDCYNKNEIANKAIKFIIKFFKLLKEYIELNKKPEQESNYLKIKNQLSSIKKQLDDVAEQNSEIILNLNKIINDFQEPPKNSNQEQLRWKDIK